MPRRPRYELPDGLAHVCTRGVRRNAIYLDGNDRRRFLAVAEDAFGESGCICHAYCLMTNHYHLLVEGERVAVSDLMWRINGFYAQAFNRRHDLTGHVFERRFFAEPVSDDAQAVATARYVVRNPLRARMCERPEDWPWSSFAATAGLAVAPPFLTMEFVLGFFGANVDVARTRYVDFVAAAPPGR